jgi:hypothetical protein
MALVLSAASSGVMGIAVAVVELKRGECVQEHGEQGYAAASAPFQTQASGVLFARVLSRMCPAGTQTHRMLNKYA